MIKNLLFIFMLLHLFPLTTNSQTTLKVAPLADSTSLKILSWNIYMLPYLGMVNGNENRAKAIAEKLIDSDYQIIVFQEAFTKKSRRVLSRRLKGAYPYQYGPANKGKLLSLMTNSGLWVVSKIPLTELGQIRFSLSRGFDMIARKGAVLFEGDFQGRSFQILATHLQAEGEPVLRRKQCHEIKDKLLNRYFRAETPQFICGDFNIDMHDNDNYNAMLTTLEAQNGDISGDIKFTYDEVDNTLVSKSPGRKRVIDYILVRNEKWVDRIERKINTFYEKIGQSYTNLSDHYAMEATINFFENKPKYQ